MTTIAPYVTQSRLGRQRHFDRRNADYLIANTSEDRQAAVLAARAAAPAPAEPQRRTSQYFYDSEWHGDQGETSFCTAYAGLHLVSDGPVRHHGRTKGEPIMPPTEFFAQIQAIDRREGRTYVEGATALALAKALKAQGVITEYRWGYTMADFIAAIRKGPVLLGLDWLEGMFYPDPKHGVIRAFGPVYGGHEIEANGCDFDDGMVRLKNSWGTSWGQNGHCYIPMEDLEWLIAAGGDMLIVKEVSTTKFGS